MQTFLIDLLLTIFVIVSLLLVLVVLLQRPRSEGLGTAFASEAIGTTFGGAASSVLVRFTTWMGIIFFLLTILLAYLYSHRYSNQSVFGQDLRKTPVGEAARHALAHRQQAGQQGRRSCGGAQCRRPGHRLRRGAAADRARCHAGRQRGSGRPRSRTLPRRGRRPERSPSRW